MDNFSIHINFVDFQNLNASFCRKLPNATPAAFVPPPNVHSHSSIIFAPASPTFRSISRSTVLEEKSPILKFGFFSLWQVNWWWWWPLCLGSNTQNFPEVAKLWFSAVAHTQHEQQAAAGCNSWSRQAKQPWWCESGSVLKCPYWSDNGVTTLKQRVFPQLPVILTQIVQINHITIKFCVVSLGLKALWHAECSYWGHLRCTQNSGRCTMEHYLFLRKFEQVRHRKKDYQNGFLQHLVSSYSNERWPHCTRVK